MDNLIIEATKYTPEIGFDAAANILSIKGESYPENTTEFYEPVFNWVKSYLEQLEDQAVTVNIDLVYFNSSSSKALINFFDVLEESAAVGKQIIVNWIHEEEDEDMIEFGEEFEEDLEAVKFNLVQKEV